MTAWIGRGAWLAVCAGCAVPTPAGPVNTGAFWDVKCGSLEARISEANDEVVTVQLKLIGEPMPKHIHAPTRCSVDITNAKLVVPGREAGGKAPSALVMTEAVTTMSVGAGEVVTQQILFEIDEAVPAPSLADADEVEVAELRLQQLNAEPLRAPLPTMPQ